MTMKRNKRKRQRGSLTVEAILSFTVFLMVSFLMLHLVKLTMLSVALQNAVSETAKQIATAAYPIVWVNGLQEQAEDKTYEIAENGIPMDELLGEDIGGAAEQFLLGTGGGDWQTVVQDFMQQGTDALWGLFDTLKGELSVQLAAHLLDGYLETSGLPFDAGNVVLRVVKLPQTDGEFNRANYRLEGQKDDLEFIKASEPDGTDQHYNQDDVIICAEYSYRIALPLIPAVELTLRSTAVEHAWLTGCLIRTSRTEGLKLDGLQEAKVSVATGGYGKCYHRKDCYTLGNASGTEEISLKQAQERGLRPCKVCSP